MQLKGNNFFSHHYYIHWDWKFYW